MNSKDTTLTLPNEFTLQFDRGNTSNGYKFLECIALMSMAFDAFTSQDG